MKKIIFILTLLFFPFVVEAKEYYVDMYTETVPDKQEESPTNVFVGIAKMGNVYWYQYRKKLYVRVDDEYRDASKSFVDIMDCDFNKNNIQVTYNKELYNHDGDYTIYYLFKDIENDRVFYFSHDIKVLLHENNEIKENEDVKEEIGEQVEKVVEETLPPEENKAAEKEIVDEVINIKNTVKSTKKKEITTTTKRVDPEDVVVTTDEILPVELLKNEIVPEKEIEEKDNSNIIVASVIVTLVIGMFYFMIKFKK